MRILSRRLTKQTSKLRGWLLAAVLGSAVSSQAQSVWNGGGGDNNWSTGANWGGTAPVAGASLQFGGTTRLTPVNDFAADTLISSIDYSIGAGSFNLTGNRIVLGGDIANYSGSEQRLTLNLQLNGTRGFYSNGIGVNMIMDGIISETGGSQGILVYMNGALSLTNSNTFTGGINIQRGSIYAYSAGALNSTTPNALTFSNTGGDSAGLQIYGVNVEVSSLTGASTNTLVTSGFVGGSPTASLTVRNTTNDTFAGRFRSGLGGAGNLDLFKAGSGTLTLMNTLSDQTGFTIVYEGTLRNGASNVLSDNSTTVVAASAGQTATLDLNGFNDAVSGLTFGGYGTSVVQTGAGTLTLNGNVTFNAAFNSLPASLTGNLALGSSTRTFNIVDSTNAANELTVGAIISGTGGISKTGTGVLVLSGANTYSGGTTLSGGTLAVTADGSLGAVPGAPATNLQFTGSSTLRADAELITVNANRSVTIASGQTATLDSNGFNFRISGVISGGGHLAVAAGSGITRLGGNNTYTGTTTIAPTATLQIGSGSTTGTLGSGNVTNNGELIIDRSNSYTLANAISGSGELTQFGTGTTILTGTNNYTGTTTISSGTLSIGGGGTTGSLLGSGTVVNNGTLRFNRTNTVTQGTHFGTISGSGAVAVHQGTVVLNALNTYTGPTQVFGDLRFNSIADEGVPSALGAPTGSNAEIQIVNGVTNVNSPVLEYTGSGDTTNRGIRMSISNGGLQILHSGTGLLKFTGDIRGTGTDTDRRLTLNGSTSGIGEVAGVIRDSNTASGFLVSFRKLGTSTWILSGANTYTGDTAIDAGILQIGNGGTTGSLSPSSAITIASGSALVFNRSDTVTQGTHFETSLSGAGVVRQNGSGTVVLNGANINTGRTTVDTGTLRFATQTALYNNTPTNWTAARINAQNGGTLAFNVGGTGEFTTGDVTTLLTNLASSSSTTNGMNAGTFLGFDTSNAAGASFTITDLIADTTGASGGTRGLTKLGTNTLELTGNNTYTGATTVAGGILQISANNALGTAAAGTTVNSGAALQLNGVSYTTAEALALNGTGISGGGALVNVGTSSYAGQITAATNATINAGGGTLTVTGGLVKNGTTLTIAGGGSVIVNGIGISGANANSDLVVDGTTLVVNANSNYNGPTTVQNSGTLVANAEVTTTQVTVSGNSTLSGTGSIANGTGFVTVNGALVVGDSTLGSPVVADFEIGGTGSTVLGGSSTLAFDIFTGAGLGDNTGLASAADRLRLFGALDATLGGTLVLGNPAALTGFAYGDQWLLFDLQGGASITGTLTLNTTALNLAPGHVGSLNPLTGVFSIVPEPSRTLLIMLAMTAIPLARRRPRS